MGDVCLRVGIKMRAALVSAVVKKSLAMASVKKELTGKIVAFVSSDIHKVQHSIFPNQRFYCKSQLGP
jgi:hypothetical protein